MLSDYRSMSEGPRSPVASYTLSDYYFVALGLLLAGYAIGHNAFAYIGIAPLYIGEIGLAFGVIVFLKSRCVAATLATLPSLMLILLLRLGHYCLWAAVLLRIRNRYSER